MITLRIPIIQLHEYAIKPKYANPGDAGLDLHAIENTLLYVSNSKLISTGISVAIPNGYFGLIRPRSGLAKSNNITLCSSGVIDSGYRGEIFVQLINHGPVPYEIKQGDRIAQLLVLPVVQVEWDDYIDELPESDRGDKGHGSSGK